MLNMGKLWLEFQQSEFQKDLIDYVGKVNDSMAMFFEDGAILKSTKNGTPGSKPRELLLDIIFKL